MPVAHIINDCLSLPQGRQAQFNVPVKAGVDPASLKTKDIIGAFLIPCQAGEGHVVSWTFGGAQRVKRKGDKFHITVDEASFVMNNIPGLLELVDETDTGESSMALLNERVRRLEGELRLATGRAETAESQLRAALSRPDGSGQAAASSAAQAEVAKSDLAFAYRKIDGLERENEALKHTENGLLRLEHNTMRNRIQLLETRLNPAQLADVKAEMEAKPPTAWQPDDPAVAALKARESEKPNTPDEDDAELARLAAKGDKEPARTEQNSTNAPRRGPDNKPVNPPAKK